MPPTARNWLKEAQTIRDRWAHAPVSGIPDDERFRDLDTIERLMQAIGADQPRLADIRLASCVFGLAPYLDAILDRHLPQLEYPSRHRARPRAGREEPYTFVSVRTLLDDFWADVRSLTDD